MTFYHFPPFLCLSRLHTYYEFFFLHPWLGSSVFFLFSQNIFTQHKQWDYWHVYRIYILWIPQHLHNEKNSSIFFRAFECCLLCPCSSLSGAASSPNKIEIFLLYSLSGLCMEGNKFIQSFSISPSGIHTQTHTNGAGCRIFLQCTTFSVGKIHIKPTTATTRTTGV